MTDKTVFKYPAQAIMARQEFSVIERRIIYIAAMRIEQGFSVQPELFENGFVLELPYGIIDNQTNWERFKKTIVKLMDRKVILKNNDTEYGGFNVVQSVDIGFGKTIKIKFTSEGALLLAELAKGYTTLNIHSAMNLTSEYSQRMYELMSKWADQKVWIGQNISEIRSLLNVPETYNFNNFKYRVLEVSKKELEEKTDIRFEYDLYKKGREYTKINFYIEKKTSENKVLDTFIEDDKINMVKINLKQIGISERYYPVILNEKQKEFWLWLKYYKMNKSLIKNPAGHLIKTLDLS